MQLRSCEFKELVAGESNGSAYEQTGCSKKDLSKGGSGRCGSDHKQKPHHHSQEELETVIATEIKKMQRECHEMDLIHTYIHT